MPDRSPARSILGGVAVILLAGVAAYVGTRAASRPEPDAPAPPAGASSPAPAAIESLDRRIAYLEKRLDLVETRLARQAEDRAGAVPPAPPPTSSTPEKADANAPSAPSTEKPSAEPAPDESPESRARNVAKRMVANRLHHTMNLFADASREGESNRSIQAVSEAMSLVQRYGLDGDATEEEIRRVFADQYAAGAREIGPLVQDGIEKADVATVRERLRAIYAETDRRLRAHFDDAEAWKEYESAAASVRQAFDEVLEEAEKKRLSLK